MNIPIGKIPSDQKVTRPLSTPELGKVETKTNEVRKGVLKNQPGIAGKSSFTWTQRVVAAWKGVDFSWMGFILKLIKGFPSARISTATAGQVDALLFLVQEGNNIYAKELLGRIFKESGGEVLFRPNSEGQTVLHMVAMSGNLEIIQELRRVVTERRFEQEVSHEDSSGKTPLHLAASSGNTKVVKFLASNMGREQEFVQDADDNTALHLAVSKGHREVVELLIGVMNQKERCSVNKENLTAFELAKKLGKNDIVLELVKNNPELRAETLSYFIRSGDERHAIELMDSMTGREFYYFDPDNGNRTALHLAVDKAQLGVVKKLIGRMDPAAIALTDSSGRRAEDLSKERSYGPIDAQFLRTIPAEDRPRALLGFIKSDDTRRSLDLIDLMSDDDFSYADREGNTCLHLAAMYGSVEVVEKLLGSMSLEQINQKDHGGKTALAQVQALREKPHSHTEGLNKSLFRRSHEILGQNPDLENELTSLEVSEFENLGSDSKDMRDLKNGLVQPFHTSWEKTASLLQFRTGEKASVRRDPLWWKGSIYADEVVNSLLSMDSCGVYGGTLLRQAIRWNKMDVFDTLIKQMTPSQLSAQSRERQTALHVAVDEGNAEATRNLIAKMDNESILLKDVNGNTAIWSALLFLSTAEEKEKASYQQIIGMFENRFGRLQLLRWAIMDGNRDAIEGLVERMTSDVDAETRALARRYGVEELLRKG